MNSILVRRSPICSSRSSLVVARMGTIQRVGLNKCERTLNNSKLYGYILNDWQKHFPEIQKLFMAITLRLGRVFRHGLD